MNTAAEMPARIRELWTDWHPDERKWLEGLPRSAAERVPQDRAASSAVRVEGPRGLERGQRHRRARNRRQQGRGYEGGADRRERPPVRHVDGDAVSAAADRSGVGTIGWRAREPVLRSGTAGSEPAVKTKVAVAEWNNATDALKDADDTRDPRTAQRRRIAGVLRNRARGSSRARNQKPGTEDAHGGRESVRQPAHPQRRNDRRAVRRRQGSATAPRTSRLQQLLRRQQGQCAHSVRESGKVPGGNTQIPADQRPAGGRPARSARTAGHNGRRARGDPVVKNPARQTAGEQPVPRRIES